MPLKIKERDKPKTGRPRASITFPAELYRALEELARRKKVSLAWVIRDAAEKYVASGE